MKHTFGEVRFFHTSAMLAEGAIPASVDDLVDWSLAGSGKASSRGRAGQSDEPGLSGESSQPGEAGQ